MKGGDDSRAGGGSKIGNPPRLTEESGVDPWLANLVRSTGPYKSPPGRKQRVLLSLGRSRGGRAPLVLRPVIVAGLLLGCGAFASAALGPWRGWIGRAYERLVPAAEPVAVSPERGRTHRLVAGSVATEALAVATPPAESAPSPVSVSPFVAPVARREPVAPPHVRRVTPLPSANEQAKGQEKGQEKAPERAEEETQSVLAGMRALRVEHDPVRARTLLARYLQRRPSGALAEEALALTIEAALANHDDDAPALGALYLRRYPGGPFEALALRAKR
jgi:hypothetical protein